MVVTGNIMATILPNTRARAGNRTIQSASLIFISITAEFILSFHVPLGLPFFPATTSSKSFISPSVFLYPLYTTSSLRLLVFIASVVYYVLTLMRSLIVSCSYNVNPQAKIYFNDLRFLFCLLGNFSYIIMLLTELLWILVFVSSEHLCSKVECKCLVAWCPL